MIAGGLTERHARALLRLTDDKQRMTAIGDIMEQKLNVSQTEKYIDRLMQEETQKRSYKKRASVLGDVRLFVNTVDKAVKVMKLAGVAATLDRSEHDGIIEFRITVPDEKTRPAMLPAKLLV
jgi:ParB family chromosome partitioning protein